jgi:predicted DsbA family dithiol-disulfide isomerase
VPPLAGQSSRRIRARIVWEARDSTHTSPWQEVSGTYADPVAYAAETPAQQVTNLAGEHGVYRAQYEATRLAHAGKSADAVSVLRAAAAAVPPSAPMAAAMREELSANETQLGDKNVVYNAIRRSKGQRDHRQP